MERSEISQSDVAVTANHDIVVIVDIMDNRPKNCIVIQKKLGKRYVCSPSHITSVIGTVEMSKFQECQENQDKVVRSIDHFLLSARLQDMGLEVGVSKIQVRHGGKLIDATFDAYKPSRWKYPVTYRTPRGALYKCSEDDVIKKVS